MTPNRASPHRKPAGGRRRRRQPDHTLVRSILRPGPPIAPTSTGLGARDRTLRHACRDRSANQARRAPPSNRSPVPPPTVGNRQIPIDPNAEPGPRGFLVWGRGCQAPISRLAPLHSEFLGSTWKPVSSSRPTSRTAARAGAVKIGRRSSLSQSSVAARPHLYGLEHAGMLVGGRDDAVEGSSPLAARRASHHNLVFGGPRDPNHDAVLRIGRETPKWRAHSSLRHCSHRTSAGCPPPRTVIGALLPRTPNS